MTERRGSPGPAGAGPAGPDARNPGRPVGRAVWVRLIVFVGIVVAGVVVAAVVGLPDVQQLRADIVAAGPVAPVLFVALNAVATLDPVPKNVFGVAAGLLFGVVAGTAVVLLAAMLGALAAFVLGRAMGRAAVERITGARVAWTRCCAVAGCWRSSGSG